MSDLNKDQSTSLYVLGYLFLRMNFWEKAKETFEAIVSIEAGNKNCNRAYIALASIALEEHNGKEALRYLHFVMENTPISSKNSALYLMKAKALWFEKRQGEVENVINEYLYLMEHKG